MLGKISTNDMALSYAASTTTEALLQAPGTMVALRWRTLMGG
jgi:hypothetical protein